MSRAGQHCLLERGIEADKVNTLVQEGKHRPPPPAILLPEVEGTRQSEKGAQPPGLRLLPLRTNRWDGAGCIVCCNRLKRVGKIQVDTQDESAEEWKLVPRPLQAGDPAVQTSSFLRGRSPYSEPRASLHSPSVRRGCDAVWGLGWQAWAPCPVACGCGSEGTAREENLNPMGVALLGPR